MKSFTAALLALATFAGSAQEGPRNATKDAMRFKLHFAQGVLEGITTENFSLLSKDSHIERLLSKRRACSTRAAQ